ncbi:MAG: hypothetical protein Kow00108_03390 [Calditrichia bacterium]
MKEVAPESTSLRKAVKWISDQKQMNPNIKLMTLINEAAIKFDLSPKDTDFLIRHFTQHG